MVLPIIFNLQQRRRRRTEHRGFRLVDNADQLTKTERGREIKGEKLVNGKDTEHTKNYKSYWQSNKTDKRFLLPLNHA